MSIFKKSFYYLLFIATLLFPYAVYADAKINIPVLCFHNFNPTVPGSMTLTPERLETQLKWLSDNGYTIIPLQEAVEYLQGKRASVPAKSVVITADDGWQSVYKYLYPIVKKQKFHVTLFIYPQTISEGKNAMTWNELKELQNTGLFDIQGHTYSHPNFKHAKRSMSATGYENFVKKELVTSKRILEDKMGTKISYLAWPFGIYDKYLEQQAANAGYDMAFTIDYKSANRGFRPMAQPRFMIIQSESMKTFAGIVGQATGPAKTRVANAEK